MRAYVEVPYFFSIYDILLYKTNMLQKKISDEKFPANKIEIRLMGIFIQDRKQSIMASLSYVRSPTLDGEFFNLLW